MKRFMTMFFMLTTVFVLAGLASASEIQVTSFRVLHSDFKAEAEPLQDLDGNYCTVLRLDGEIPENLALDQKVYKTDPTDDGGLYFYISSKETEITFKAPGYTSATVAPPGGMFKLGKVYYVRLKTVESSRELIPVIISSTPEGARIVLNGENAGNTTTGLKLESGKYELLLGFPGYEIKADIIEVRPDQKNVFAYDLVKKGGAAPTADVPVPASPDSPILFFDFENGNLDNWIKVSGEWAVAGGNLLQASDARPAIILTGNEKLENYMIEVDARKSSGPEGLMVIIGSNIDNNRGIAWNIGGWNNQKSILMSYTNFAYNQFNSIDGSESRYSVEDNKWYRLKIVVEGAQVKCFIDNNLIIDYGVPEIAVISSGRIGFGSYRTKVSFDNLKVTRLP